MLQLVQLRWLAVAGQMATIALTVLLLGARLPLAAMASVLTGLILLNIASLALFLSQRRVANVHLFGALLLDVVALFAQLYLSGGATNPFVSLFLLHVVIAAMLLDRWSVWVIFAATAAAFATLTRVYLPIVLPPPRDAPFHLHIEGMWACFALVAVLLVLFIGRINANLRTRDSDLADLREQAVQEDHIVRIGLLASGAAHELGTPLSSLAVILGDWRRIPQIAADPAMLEEVAEMQAEVGRCKAIVTGILLAAGDARGEAAEATSVRVFLNRAIGDWRAARGFAAVAYDDGFGPDVTIATDAVLQQAIVNLLDNAADASPAGFTVELTRVSDAVIVTVRDHGPGFAAEILSEIGKPYQSTKPRAGAGLGLFLVSNVMRKLGGSLSAANLPGGGAEVILRVPIAALALPERR